jgi:hypothetical protein
MIHVSHLLKSPFLKSFFTFLGGHAQMKVFKIQGLRGILSFLLALLLLFVLVLALPSMFCTVLWNALVFEELRGPMIDWYQGGILWMLALCTFNLIFRPKINFQLGKWPDDQVPKP